MFLQPVEPGSLVRFRIASVLCPETETIAKKITDRLEVTGRVVFLSDAGEKPDHFAVIEVTGIMSPLVVPVGHVEMISPVIQESVAEMT